MLNIRQARIGDISTLKKLQFQLHEYHQANLPDDFVSPDEIEQNMEWCKNKAYKRGRKQKYNREEVRDAVRKVSMKHRYTLQVLSASIGVPTTTLQKMI